MLRLRIAASVAVLVLLGVLASLIQLKAIPSVGDERYDDLSSLGEPLVPVIIGIIAVLLANWFQRRAAFLESLRGLWSHVVEARLAINDHLVRTGTSQDDYWKAWRALSRAIDETRAVYRNVGESESERGLFPFQQMHDMRRALKQLGPDTQDEALKKRARHTVDTAWNSLRRRFLDEFDPPSATNPTTIDGTRDDRRESTGPLVG